MLRLKEWLAPATIIVLAGGICWLGYVVVYRMPDIEKKASFEFRVDAGQDSALLI